MFLTINTIMYSQRSTYLSAHFDLLSDIINNDVLLLHRGMVANCLVLQINRYPQTLQQTDLPVNIKTEKTTLIIIIILFPLKMNTEYIHTFGFMMS